MPATPGVTYAYSNTNFTILQLVYEVLCGRPYVEGVNAFVFGPMGLALGQGEMSTSPDATRCTLGYTGGDDPVPGQAWPAIPCVAAGGWIGWPHGALQFLIGVRERAVLNGTYTDRMLKNELGWYRVEGRYGTYYYHNGALVNELNQWIRTGIVRFEKGYDAVLFTNSDGPDPVTVLIDAFDYTDA